MEFTLHLGIAAGVLQLVAFGLYNKQVFQGTSTPNTATWTLWAFLTVLNASSYAAMTADLAKSILPIASALAGLGTFSYALFAGKFRRIDPWDWLVLSIGIVSGLVWWWYQSATYANLIVVGAVVVSFVPLYRGLLKNPALEKALPWYVWTTAYVVLTVVGILRWKGQYQDLVYPVSMLFLHLAVGLLTLRTRPIAQTT
jgi:hypothetical protein